MTGTFYGLGVGPGDPGLLTLKAKEVLEMVSVVAGPVSRPGETSLALDVVRDFLRDDQIIVNLTMPMTSKKDSLEEAWNRAAAELLYYLKEGRDLAFVTLGDASLYSTYGYLVKQLQELVPQLNIVTVPGVTSFAAAAAKLNLSLATGDEPLAVIPALEEPSRLKEYLEVFPNIVLMKVARQYDGIVRVLEETGLDKKAVLVSRCGRPGESFTYNLTEGVGHKQDYMSLIIVKGAVE